MAYGLCQDVNWPRCTSSWFPFDWNVSAMSIAPWRSGLWDRRLNVDGEPIGDLNIPASQRLFVLGDLTELPTIQLQVRWWLSDYSLSAVSRSAEPSEVPELGALMLMPMILNESGTGAFFYLIGGPGLGHRASICFAFDWLWEVWSTASFSLPTSVVYFIRLAICSVLAFSFRPIVDIVETRNGDLEVTLKTSNETLSNLELQVASRDAETAVGMP